MDEPVEDAAQGDTSREYPGETPGETPGQAPRETPGRAQAVGAVTHPGGGAPGAGGPPMAAPGGATARDHLANERTLLAWARTSIAVLGLGFVVARFGLLIRELGGRLSRPLSSGTSTAFGVAFTVAGGFLLLLALIRYLRTGREIEAGDYTWSPILGILLASTLLFAAALLSIYLLITG